MGVNNLANVVTRQRGGRGSNSRPLSHQSDALATRVTPHSYISLRKIAFAKACMPLKVIQHDSIYRREVFSTDRIFYISI